MKLKRYQNKVSVCHPMHPNAFHLHWVLCSLRIHHNYPQNRVDHGIMATRTFPQLIHKPQTIPDLTTFTTFTTFIHLPPMQ